MTFDPSAFDDDDDDNGLGSMEICFVMNVSCLYLFCDLHYYRIYIFNSIMNGASFSFGFGFGF